MHVGTEGKVGLTQGGSSLDITVGTVVYVDVHCMVLFHLHTTGDKTGKV